jgi:hypothetical protein
MALPTNTTNATVSLDTHAGLHNDTNAAVNALNATVGNRYSSATHSAGTTISVPHATHGLRATQGLIVQLQNAATGDVVSADVNISSSGDVTITFGVSQLANTVRTTIIG